MTNRPFLLALVLLVVPGSRLAHAQDAVAPPATTPPTDAAPPILPPWGPDTGTGDAPPTPTTVEAPPPEARASPVIAPPVAPSAPLVEGTVLGHRGNDVIVDRGREDGVDVDTLFELFENVPIDLGDGEIAYERKTIARGRVRAVTAHRCLVRLGINETVPVGAGAATTARAPTASAVHPPRTGGYWVLDATGRLFAVNSALGGGFLGDLGVTYRGERPFFVSVRAIPSGFTVHRTGRGQPFESASSAGAIAYAGYDHTYFGFGAGFGAVRVLSLHTYQGDAVSVDPPGVGFTFGITGRIGPLDGLHVGFETGFTSLAQRSRVGHLVAWLQLPFTQRLAAMLRGGSGFGVTGYDFVDIAARMRVRGGGGRGTTFVAPFLGWARLDEFASSYGYDERPEPHGHRGGASAGVTVEHRF
ncbi:MAG: hypothetical protein U0230_22920 [Polyangiales bacterium]